MPNIPGPLIINSGIIARLGGEANAATSNYVKTTIDYDYAIGGIPFLSGVSNRNSYFRRRYTRDLSPITKDQFDNGQQVGEQSFTGWWLRSQMSFHGGSGILYSDSGIDPSLAIRYQDGYGVNPWTINQLTLLPSTTQALTSANSNLYMRSVNDGTNNGILVADGANLRMLSGTGTIRTYTVTGMTGTILSITDDGANYYVATSTGIYSGPLTGAVAGTLYATVSGSSIVLGYQSDRVCVAQGQQVFFGVVKGDNLTTKTANYTANSSGWVWTCFAGGPSAIYASGYSGVLSQIFAFTIDNTGSVPIIDAGTVVAELPHGEIINNIYGYLQQFIGITTTKGFRVAQFTGSGAGIQYGQLIWYTDAALPNASTGIYGDDRFLYVSVNNCINGASGLVRIDLGTTTTGSAANSSYAYAKDIAAQTGSGSSAVIVTGNTVSACTLGNTGQMAVSVAGQGVFIASATNVVNSGQLLTSRIRYNTTEPKLFKYLTLRAPTGFAGNINVQLSDPTGATNNIATVNGNTFSLENIGLGYPLVAEEWINLTFTLQGNNYTTGMGSYPASTSGPTLNSWQIKGYPGTVMQRLLTVPVLVFDHMKDKFGQRVGYSPTSTNNGSAWAVMQQFEALATSGQVALFQDLNTGENQLVIIADYELEMLAPPSPNEEGIGGYLTLSLRTIP